MPPGRQGSVYWPKNVVAASALISVTDSADCLACPPGLPGSMLSAIYYCLGQRQFTLIFSRRSVQFTFSTGSWYPEVESKHLIRTNVNAINLSSLQPW